MGYRLGVDLGTTFTAAAVDEGLGPAMLGLGNRALQVPSVLYLQDDGTFLCAEAAERRAAADPSRAVREFKRRIGDTVPILVTGQPFSPQALTAELLTWVIATATERQGSPPDEVVLTHPANWGGYKRELMDQVIALADVPTSLTCTEPEAAATQYAARAHLTPGDRVAVYDLGGGTFDICILQKHDTGFSILGSPDGVEHLGGIDFDEAVFQHVIATLGDQVGRLNPDDPQARAALGRLRRDCVEAKEAISNDIDTVVPVNLPGVSTTVRLTRAELETLITPALRDTLAATHRALRSAKTAATDLAAIVLVGGSSRIPLVSHLLSDEFGLPTAMDTHPKHDIALGAVQFHPPSAGRTAPLPEAAVAPGVVDCPAREAPNQQAHASAPSPRSPPQAPPTSPTLPATLSQPAATAGDAAPTPPKPAQPPPDVRSRRPSRKPLLVGLGGGAVIAVAIATVFLLGFGDNANNAPGKNEGGRPTAESGPSPSATNASSPTPAPTARDDPRWQFFTADRKEYASPWFEGQHRVMIGYGCTPAPYFDPDPACPGGQGFHHGIDVAMPCGTPLFSAVDGVVLDPASSGGPGPAYGKHPFRIRTDTVDVLVGHTRRVFVEPGDQVRTGQRIALASDSGAPDGCHLHFEVRRLGRGVSDALDPAGLLQLS